MKYDFFSDSVVSVLQCLVERSSVHCAWAVQYLEEEFQRHLSSWHHVQDHRFSQKHHLILPNLLLPIYRLIQHSLYGIHFHQRRSLNRNYNAQRFVFAYIRPLPSLCIIIVYYFITFMKFDSEARHCGMGLAVAWAILKHRVYTLAVLSGPGTHCIIVRLSLEGTNHWQPDQQAEKVMELWQLVQDEEAWNNWAWCVVVFR